ncbi:glycosyltransferase family 39 protein [Ideonella sp. DXS29W]|uniref:Glycosyltransferase family 39 protein n=1 Tax=Ideonella lacteola TaxID=2984193 RepID=A0ABU9BNM3_9BURK
MPSRCTTAGRCPHRSDRSPWAFEWGQEHSSFLALVLVLIGLTVARAWVVVHVNAGLHVDEAQYWAWSKALDWGYYSKPPMIAALIAASTQLLGDGLLGVKALAMVCYPLTAWVLYRWVSEVLADVTPHEHARPYRAGRLAALLFIASPVAGLLGLAATTDAPLLLAWALASLALWRAWRDGRWSDWLLLGLWVGLGVMSKYTMAAFAVSAIGLMATVRRRATRAIGAVPGLAMAASVALVCVAPNLMWNAAHDWPTLRHTAEITVGAQATPMGVTLASYVGGLLLLLGPLVAVWALAWPWTRRGEAALSTDSSSAPTASTSRSVATRREAWWAAAWLSGPLLLIGAAQSLHARAQVNWTAPALIGGVLALALWVQAERPHRRLRGWYAVLALQAALIGALTLASDVAQALHRPLPRQLDVWARMRGWEEAFSQLRPAADAYWRDQTAQGQSPTVLGSERAVLANGAYAWRAKPPQWLAFRQDPRAPHNHFELMSPLRPSEYPQPVLIVGEGPLEGPLLQALDGAPRRLASTEVEQTPGRSLHLELWQAELAPQSVLARGPGDTPPR